MNNETDRISPSKILLIIKDVIILKCIYFIFTIFLKVSHVLNTYNDM